MRLDRQREPTSNRYRKFPRVRVPMPFPCSLARLESRRWFNRVQTDAGIVNDVSLRGARVTTDADMKPGDRVSLSLKLPKQVAPAEIAVATVRWSKDQSYGLAFQRLSLIARSRLRKYMAVTAQVTS